MNYTKYLRWALLGGLGLVFFIPFVISDGSLFPNMFFPFITGKNFGFRILIEVLLGLYVLLAIREPKYRPRASLLLWAFLAFVVWVGIGTIFSVDPVKSFWSNFERMQGYITVLHLFAYFLILGAIAQAEGWWDKLFQISIASGVLQALYSLGQLLRIGGLAPSSQSGARLDGTFGNATYLAVFMLFNFFLTLYMLVRQRRSPTMQAVYGVALVLQGVVLYYTETRGALLGVIGGLIIAALFVAWRATGAQWRTLRKVSFWGLGVIAVLIIAFFALRGTPVVKDSATLQRLSSISLADRTTAARFQIWDMALKGFVQSPKTVVVGWGQENFNFVFNKYYQPSMYDQEQWFDRAHDQFLDWLIADGLPAMLLYISFFGLAVWVIVRSDVLEAPEQGILLGLLAAYAFNNIFVFDDIMSSVYFFAFLAFIHGLSRRALPGWMFLSKPAGDRTIAVAAPLVAVVVIFGAWVINAPGIARASNLLNAVTTQAAGANGQATQKDPKQNLQEFQQVLGPGVWPGTPLGRQEVVEQLLQYASTLAGSSSSVDPSVEQDTFNLAQSAGKEMLAERPHDARLELFYGAFLDSFGQYTQAQQYLHQALADSPGKQQILFEIGVSYLNAGDNTDALATLKTAFDEAQKDDDARILYAVGLYYAKDNKAADALLIQRYGTVLVDDSRILQVYVNTKQFDRVIGIWKNRAQAHENDPQSHLGLAAAYFAAGDKKDSIAELQRSAQLDPAIAPQVQSLIDQINNGTLKPGQ